MYFYPYDDYDWNDVYYDELSAPSLGISAAVTPLPSFTPLAGGRGVPGQLSAIARAWSEEGIPLLQGVRHHGEYERRFMGRPPMRLAIPSPVPLSPTVAPRRVWQQQPTGGWYKILPPLRHPEDNEADVSYCYGLTKPMVCFSKARHRFVLRRK